MRRGISVILVVLLLAGCERPNQQMDRVLGLRSKLQRQVCGFTCKITADYEKSLHSFEMDCSLNSDGSVDFCITKPDSICNIQGTCGEKTGKLTFDDTVLSFPLLANDRLSPISGPWVLMKTLQGGYITSCGSDGEFLQVSIHDSYEDDALALNVWINRSDQPIQSEIFWKGRRVLTIEISNFEYL